MNIFDIDVKVNGFVNTKLHKRHVSYTNNIVHINKLNTKYINQCTKHVIIKYNKFINQRNISTIIVCIKYGIKIIPILYQMYI